MNRYTRLLSLGLGFALSPQVLFADTSSAGIVPALSPTGKALARVEADRASVINDLALRVAERDRSAYIATLAQMENHQLIQLLVAESSVSVKSFNQDIAYDSMVYTALSTPCRILDTRNYSAGADPIQGGIAREVWSYDIDGQGGDNGCAEPLIGKAALVVSLTAVAPDFPSGTFPTVGYGTLLAGMEMVPPDWQEIPPTPGNYKQFSYNTPPFNKAASVSWDTGTTLNTTLAVVNTDPINFPNAVLYTSGQSHYVMDAVGYFEKPDLCPAETTFLAGSCWGAEQDSKEWFFAGSECAAVGGRLPPASLINGLVMNGDLEDIMLWADGYYSDGVDFYGQVTSSALGNELTKFTYFPYRCIFTPLINH